MNDSPRERLKALITPEIVSALADSFPDCAPDPSTPDRQVWIDVGSVRVVRFLRTLLEEAEDGNSASNSVL